MAETIYANQRQRYDVAANWTANNPILLIGEIGIESDTSKYKFGDGTTPWNSLSYVPIPFVSAVTFSTSALAAGATQDITASCGDVFQLLSFTASTPCWIRIYGTSSARSADTRTEPGGTVPAAGNEYYAELATTLASQTIRLSPVPTVQATAGNTFIRVKNMDVSTRTISVTLSVLQLDL